MRFFLDHDVPEDIARVLRQAGHEVTKVIDVLEPTATDPEVLDYAARYGQILITCNRDDFLELAAEKSHWGLIVLIRRRSRIAECAALVKLLDRAGETGIDRNINFA